jgi:hypothetical protein
MTRLNAIMGKTTDVLSAAFLLLALLVAGGHGQPPALSATQAAAQTGVPAANNGGHRSVPVITNPELFAAEAKDAPSAKWDDGKSKSFFVPATLEFAAFVAAVGHSAPCAAQVAAIAASDFDARAPPAIS